MRPLIFDCEGATLAGSLHPAAGDTGVVIVTGGVQTRHGAHRAFRALAERLAAAGHPVLRFDRRGVGDSDGDDPGFRDSRADLAAAVAALRTACPDVRRVAGWGLCDGATALAFLAADLDLDGVMLANPWTFDAVQTDGLPDAAAIRARYRERLLSLHHWKRLITGGIDLRGMISGLRKAARSAPPPTTVGQIDAGLARFAGRVLILLAERDATGQAFAAAFPERPGWDRVRIPGATHTFPGKAVGEALAEACLGWLAKL